MKKVFSMLLLLCGLVTLSATLVVNADEDPSFTLTFKSATGTSDSTTALKVTSDLNTILEGADANKVTVITATDKAYLGKSGYGLKFGNSSNPGYITFTLNQKYNIKKIVVNAAKFNNDASKASVGLSNNAEDAYVFDTDLTSDFTDYPYTLSETTSSSVLRVGTSGKRGYIKSVTIYYTTEASTTPSYDTVFNYNYEESPENVIVSTDDGKKVEFVSEPLRTGYIFLGWYDAAEGGNKVENLTSSEENHNKTLYAHWEVDTYAHAIISTSNFKVIDSSQSGSYDKYNGTHEIDGLDSNLTTVIDKVSFASSNVMSQSSTLQFKSQAGYIKNSIAISGHIKSITIAIENGEFKVSTSTSEMSAAGENETKLTTLNKKFVVENPEDTYFYIQAGDGVANATSIDIAYEYVEKQTYTISFNEGLGTFVEGKGADITAELGTTTTVVLPTATDMATRPYKYTVLGGWSDGTTTFKPGASVQVSGNKTFSAVYKAPSNLTIAQAIEVADIAGATATTYSFSTKATIKEINDKQVVLTDSSTTETFVAYNPSDLSSLAVGDQVTVVGKIKVYNSIKEYDAPKVTVIKPAYATAFQAEATKASLRLDDDVVCIRFGNIISAASYNANATYGVVVTKNADVLNGLTKEGLEELSPTYAVDCHPVRVNAQGEEDSNGEYYQFALVLTGVPQAEFTEVIYAAMYVIDANNKVYLAEVKSASVKSVAAAYLEGDTSNFSANTIDILNILANA